MKMILISLSIMMTTTLAYAEEPKVFPGAPDSPEANRHDPVLAQSHRTMEACNDRTGQCLTTYGGGVRTCSNIRPKMSGEELERAREICVASFLPDPKKTGGKPGDADGEVK